MSKNTLLSELINYVSANGSGNVTIAAPTSGLALDVSGSGNFTGQLTLGSTITNGTYTYTLPSATGTLALTSSLGSYVPYTGATANVELGVYDLKADSIYAEGSGGVGGALQLKQYSTAAINEIGYSSIGTLASGVFYFTSSATVPNFKNFVLNPSGLTDNTIVTYTLPDASGTLALTSNLSAYLPLSGGTLTGALSGTSATFSGNVTLTSTATGGLIITNNNNSHINLFRSTGPTANWGLNINGNGDFNIDESGVATVLNLKKTTGAATFSSSVTASKDGAGNANTNTTGSQLILTRTAGGGEILGIRNTGASNGIYGTGYTAQIISDGNNAVEMYTTGAQPLILGTNATTRLVITGAGNVGIGTTSPSGILNLATANDTILTFTANSVRTGYLEAFNNGSSAIFNIFADQSSTPLAFGTNGSERMRITSGGDVLISTSTSVINPPGFARVLNVRNTDAAVVISNTSGTAKDWSIGALVSGSLGIFDGSSERMRITSGGVLLITTTTTTGLATGSSVNVGMSLSGGVISSQVNNNSNQYWSKATGYTSGDFTAHFVNGNYVGGISTNGSTTTYAVASDYRLKEDLKAIKGLEILNKIKVYDYKWKSSDERMDGVIAHELAEILPYAVQGVKDGKRMQSVDYSKIVPVMVQAIKELKAELDLLKNK